MALTLKDTQNFVVGANDAYFPDAQNKEARQIWAAFIAEHTEDGFHDFLPKLEEDTYAGTAAAQTVSLTDTTLTPILWLWLFSENDGYLYFVAADMPAGYAKRHDGIYADYGITLDGAGFDLTAASVLNENAIDYYFVAWGIGQMGDPQGDNNDPPTWIEHGEDILAGTGEPACRVEEDLWTKFLVEHTDAGVHNNSDWDSLLEFEVGSFTPDGSAAQEIDLADITGTPNVIWLLPRTMQPAGVHVTAFGNLRLLQTDALPDTGYVTPGAGKFTVDGSKITNLLKIFELLSDTTDGSTTFTDTSKYARTIDRVGTDKTIEHSTDYAHTGTSCIKFAYNTGSGHITDYLRPATTMFNGASGLFLTSGFSLSCAFRMASAPSVGGDIIRFIGYHYPTSSPTDWYYGYFGLRINTDGTVSAVIDNNTLSDTIDGTTDCADDAWHTLELTFEDGDFILYIDSGEEGTRLEGTIAMDSFTYAAPWVQIGSGLGANSGETAYIDDILLYFANPYFRAYTGDYFDPELTIDYIAMIIP